MKSTIQHATFAALLIFTLALGNLPASIEVENQSSITVTATTINPNNSQTLDQKIVVPFPQQVEVGTGNFDDDRLVLVRIQGLGEGIEARFECTLFVRASTGTVLIEDYVEVEGMSPQLRVSTYDGIGDFEDGTRVSEPGQNQPGQRKFDFVVTGDPQYSQHEQNLSPGREHYLLTNETLRQMTLRHVTNPLSRGIIIAGDLTQDAVKSEFDNYKEGIREFTRSVFYEGLGNHDFSQKSFWFNYDVSEELRTYVATKPRNTLLRNSIDIHYSWDWHDVHFVQLNLAPVDGLTYQNDGFEDPRNALTFLKDDLARHVGDSFRPVVIISHLGFDRFSFPLFGDVRPNWWGGW